MRCFEPLLWQSGAGSITDVELEANSRDDIPQLLLGLQYLYMIPALREQVLRILDEMIPEEIDRTTGRPGMVMWAASLDPTGTSRVLWNFVSRMVRIDEPRSGR